MSRFVRYGGAGLLSVGGLAVVGLAAIQFAAERRMSREWEVEVARVAVSSDPEIVARGRHLATVKGCSDCHGEDLGGSLFIDGMPMARLYASNLTPGEGGVGGAYEVEDWVRSIRHGVGPDRKALLFMPSAEYAMSDEDLGALISYLRTLPPVDREPVESVVGPVGRALFLKGDLPLLQAEAIDHGRSDWSAPPAGPTPEYGRYLAAACTGCHGADLAGGPVPGGPPDWPPAADLTPRADGLGGWSEEDFFRSLREGVRPDGTAIDEAMPWRNLAHMEDDEIRATWLYLRSLPASPGGA